MSPEEKAKELIDKLYPYTGGLPSEYEKKIALICVEEILKVSVSYAGKDYEFYQQVKTEIEKY
jgi:hypothetical protein